jgi:putative addiction module CopG family antidote
MTIQLPEELERFVQMNVRSGRFASENEVIGEAVRLLRQKEETEPATETPSTPELADGLAKPVWERILDIMSEVPDDAFERIPPDSSEQLDHYIYGTPKRPTP